MSGGFFHVSVLLEECIEALNIKPNGIYIDGTLGAGGHSRRIAERLTTGRLISIDRDENAIENAKNTLCDLSERITLVKGNFDNISAILYSLGVDKVDGMLFDLGVSSPQLDDASRGFSYMENAPLDMRMDTSSPLTAREIVNCWDENEIKRILYEYGEERYSARIAAKIIKRRAEKPIETTSELVDIIRSAMPAAALREKQHPAKRSFQAIRIAVNDELGSIERMLAEAPDRLNTGGRLAVISFQSLEDRIVKNAIRKREKGCTCPPDFPKCVCGFVKTLKQIGKPITPSSGELEKNPRSRSAKLRVAERV